MREVWSRQEGTASAAGEGLLRLMEAVEALEQSEDGQRASKGHVPPAVMRVTRAALEVAPELGELGRAMAGEEEGGWRRARGQVERLWQAYRRSWRALCEAEEAGE
jgi:hypothetical protein